MAKNTLKSVNVKTVYDSDYVEVRFWRADCSRYYDAMHMTNASFRRIQDIMEKHGEPHIVKSGIAVDYWLI